MNTKENLIDQRLVLLQRHWRHSPPAEFSPPTPHRNKTERQLTVAISREAGSLGSEVGQELGKRLDWPVYDREILQLIAKRAVLRTDLLESIDEQDSDWLGETMRSLGHPHELCRAGYFYHLTKVLAALAAHGKCVIVGRGATSMLPAASTLKLRVIAPWEQRVERIAQQQRVSRSEAEAIAHRIDRERREFVASHFHRDVGDPHEFDLVLNSDRYTPTELAEMAWVALRIRQLGYATEVAVAH
jgi:hypothetical protein